MDNKEELKIEFDIVKGCYTIMRETPYDIQYFIKDIKEDKKSNGKIIRHLRNRYDFSNRVLEIIDPKLYEALLEFDVRYRTNYMMKYLNSYAAQDVEIEDNESMKDYNERCKQRTIRSLQREGISISYNVGVIGASKKFGIIERIKLVNLAKKQAKFIGANCSYKFKLDPREFTYLSNPEVAVPSGADTDLENDPDFEIISLDDEEPKKKSIKDSFKSAIDSIKTISKSASIQASKNMPSKLINTCRNKVGKIISIVDLKFQEMRKKVSSFKDILKKNNEKQNKSNDKNGAKPSILERIIQSRIFDLGREEAEENKVQNFEEKPDKAPEEKVEPENRKKPEDGSEEKIEQTKTEENSNLGQEGNAKANSPVQEKPKPKNNEAKPKKLISKRKSIQASKKELREAQKYKNSYKARIEEAEKAKARREAIANLSPEEKARLKTERYKEAHRAPIKRPIERVEPVATKPDKSKPKPEKVVYKKKTKFTRKLKSKDDSIKNKKFKGLQDKKKLVIAGAMGFCILLFIGSAVTLATNLSGLRSYNKIETQIERDLESLDSDDSIGIYFEGGTTRLARKYKEIPNIEINFDEDDKSHSEDSVGEPSEVKIVGMDTEEETESTEETESKDETEVAEVPESKEYELGSIRVGTEMNIDTGEFFEGPNEKGKKGNFESHKGETKIVSIIGVRAEGRYFPITDKSETVLELIKKYPNAEFVFHFADDAPHQLGWVEDDKLEEIIEREENYIIEDDSDER